MASTNKDLVDSAMDVLRSGLAPFVAREFNSCYGKQSWHKLREILGKSARDARGIQEMDVHTLLKIMWASWNDVYRNILGYTERSLVSELLVMCDNDEHRAAFSSDDAYRALDSTHRLLLAISAPVGKIEAMKMDLLHKRYDEYARTQRRKTAGTTVTVQAAGGLTPWREVISPHSDVASGRYQQAEFAADLWQVHLGEGSSEYNDPQEFFRRTYLTDSLRHLLDGAIRRLAGTGEDGGDPVIQIQTNFGGGKTHSMLALYHLFSGVSIDKMPGIDTIVKDGSVSYSANRVVLVGHRISPGNPDVKQDGTKVRTLWGELAWQLGHEAGGIEEARRAYELVREDDENATNPGDTMRKLFNKYGPSLILVDEWVAYARQLHDAHDLPAGTFETQFTFAQALSESAKLAKSCLLVISLPASDTAESPHAQEDDTEVGGTMGREALRRLRNVIGRVESSWRPANAEESFEIVRRRLFQPISGSSNFASRDNTARAFHDLYNENKQMFPVECSDSDYKKRIISAYPIHPEVFERLYTDWSTLIKFQRTRGVLRLMAAVIHSLWEKGDRSPLIMPAHIHLEDPRVQTELTRYMSENWVPVIERDIDGVNALPQKLDGEIPNLGKYSACRRVARTIYLGSAPTPAAANRGVEDRRIRLGCALPGEPPAVFGDAIRRLANAATFLYRDGVRYWYSTQPTVTKLAKSRSEEYRQKPDEINKEIRRRLQENLKDKGDFVRIHIFPSTGQDVQDARDAGLVVLEPTRTYEKGSNSSAVEAAARILESHGTSSRLYKNTLAFLAADGTRLQDLEEGIGLYLAWQSILDDSERLDLPPNQVKQARSHLNDANGTVNERTRETYRWLLVPVQESPTSDTEWRRIQLSEPERIASLASKRMTGDALLTTSLAGNSLRMELDRIPLWRGDHVAILQLVDDFARYSYLPMLKNSSVLLGAIHKGLSMMTWEIDSFAYADSYDDVTKRYRGLRTESPGVPEDTDTGILVRPDIARKQLDAETAGKNGAATNQNDRSGGSGSGPGETNRDDTRGLFPDDPVVPSKQGIPTRYHGSVTLNEMRPGRDVSQIADEVISHLVGLLGADVKLTLSIDAKIPEGVSKNVVRTVIENSRSLNFDDAEFESE